MICVITFYELYPIVYVAYLQMVQSIFIASITSFVKVLPTPDDLIKKIGLIAWRSKRTW